MTLDVIPGIARTKSGFVMRRLKQSLLASGRWPPQWGARAGSQSAMPGFVVAAFAA